jgi:DNA-binding NarL/FixJ family response regulator
MALGETLATESRRARAGVLPRGLKLYSGRKTLSPRLLQVRSLIAQGLSDKEIAARLGVTVGTAKIYGYHLRQLTGQTRSGIMIEHFQASQYAAEGLPRMGAFE